MPTLINLYYGTFVQLPRNKSGDKHELSINRGALWEIGGRIQGYDWTIASEGDLQNLIKKNRWIPDDGDHPNTNCQTRYQLVRAREELNEFFFPGFIDTHIHAPQYPNSGLFGSSTLLNWLSTYTFPLESAFGSLASKPNIPPPKAGHIYNQVITRTLANGTTCASYFATIHVPATNLLATLCSMRGQRALIGRVCMDNPTFCPDYYRDESPEASLSKTKETIAHVHSIDPTSSRIHPIITPRFAPTCSPTALQSLAALAASFTPPLHIQTHISENKDEVALVSSLFPSSSSYADVYDQHSLLTPRTILAHGVHLTPSEHTLIHSRGAKISHCPASNSALGSGLCPVRKILNAGITVGLGTDVSGGYSPSVLEATRQACLVSRLVASTTPDGTPADVLSVEEALYLATRGGAAVVDMADEIGGFEKSMHWDAQLIRLGTVDGPGSGVSNVDVFGWESWTEKIHKWVWNGDDRNVRAVWVGGSLVHSVDEVAEGKKKEEKNNAEHPRSWGLLPALSVAAAAAAMGAWVLVRRR